jgi:MFS family permease
VVSFLADVSSEIAYPLFPLFVTGVLGAPVAVLGVIEGIAEATASITKYPFGQAADYTGRRRPFVLAGYGLGALGKLVIALATSWPLALAGRFVDRFGKGMRTAARDDLIAAGTKPEQQGLAFGLHRTMDTMGAVLGPLVALVLVELHVPLRWIFAIAVIPGLLSVLAILLMVKERREKPRRSAFRLSLPKSPAFRWLLAGSLLFAAGNSSDMFILLKAQDIGLGTSAVILLYVLYNVMYSAASLPLGGLSDRVGQYPLVLTGYAWFAAVYVGFAVTHSSLMMAVLFAAYGLYIGPPRVRARRSSGAPSPQASAPPHWASITPPQAWPASRPAPSAARCGRPLARGRHSLSGRRRPWSPPPSCCLVAVACGRPSHLSRPRGSQRKPWRRGRSPSTRWQRCRRAKRTRAATPQHPSAQVNLMRGLRIAYRMSAIRLANT